jgi:hypothetical protein
MGVRWRGSAPIGGTTALVSATGRVVVGEQSEAESIVYLLVVRIK